ncbi:MAG: filamentous hemagglutinin N-terminal domain-containing protein [Pseudomonadota bacterium]|nr:filamentous hemagglutinin N-terminal domain-containing protein [Pseudomonadota bacterium]MDP1572660.1 filamentous hemagglutinin N-terminal domain-containing protein [Pseudomonadota bacterium]MDP1906533.1 filamentous hemagglutinin N-terminal domain-containing protein [Pseudomonadota bacterium]
MNHSYRLVWNDRAQRYVPAPETARARGKSAGGRAIKPLVLSLAALFAVPAWAEPPALDALPEGGRVSAGQAVISQVGARMEVVQGSERAILEWNRFDIGAQAQVNFAQPGSLSVALNRVLGADASQIFGRLTANGQVWLVNPHGILFGPGSRVDVGGLVASTLDTLDSDFLSGRSRFQRNGATGAIVNQGEIHATGDGQGGGLIALFAPEVRNEGLISARLGNVALAAGDQITLEAGADGHLRIAVDPATVHTLIENRHLIQADGGQIILASRAANELLSSVVANSGTLQARTLVEKAGRILLLADMDHGEVRLSGTLDASAPQLPSTPGGEGMPPAHVENGGYIETSAGRVRIADGTRVTTKADHGQTGTWLIDPKDYKIATSGGDISGTELSSQLASNNIEIQSSTGAGEGNGDILVDDAVNWSANTLTLTAARDIQINAVMTASGSAALAMNTGTANGADAGVAGGTVRVGFAPGGGFAGRVDFPGRSGTGFLSINGQDYTVINSLGAEGSTSGSDLQGMDGNLFGHYALGSDIDASATVGWNGGAGFMPIGQGTYYFQGQFNGLGHTISGLSINRPSLDFTATVARSASVTAPVRSMALEMLAAWWVAVTAPSEIATALDR